MLAITINLHSLLCYFSCVVTSLGADRWSQSYRTDDQTRSWHSSREAASEPGEHVYDAGAMDSLC